ncbi:thioredoxin reductase [Bradyrhizobium sp. JR7.2]|uniref:NAD(P)/FAD-dependent oxidoreductase n=1 Tax=Bradyrhizobium TaxID=374 RepID=UPI0024AF20C4|nr:NAD(P)/FAD-dependent oxidoreductase [Bradyrhizobium barranii]WFT93523.1 NAD(P)/FAD-dependent oxidoreductase [Bradyrhizobium barranii]
MKRTVTIIGAGPAGLTAARVLRDAGIKDVLVVERNEEPGGLPRICGHSGWGILDFHRLWDGPTYARKLVQAARDVEILTNHSVVGLQQGGVLQVNGPRGTETIESRAVLIATGIRETSRAARLISGPRPWGVVTTGAFQEMVYKGGMRPFRRPLVVGTELVSFSALLTARHAKIRPAAMIEAGERIVARRPGDWIARLVLGVPVLTRTSIVSIEGRERVTGVVINRAGRQESIVCDGVIISGMFVPETGMLRASHIEIDSGTGGPSVNSDWRCSDPAYYVAGNVLRPVEHSGKAAGEGALAAHSILKGLDGTKLSAPEIAVKAGNGLRYIYPQRLTPEGGPVTLFGRVSQNCRGRLVVKSGANVFLRQDINMLPERRLTLNLPASVRHSSEDLHVSIEA